MEGGEQEAGVGGGTDRQSSSELSKQLLRACVDGDLNKVKCLVEVEHVDPHSCRDEHYHNTPLHWASWYGHLDIVRYLVEERNCDVECRNKYETTPLHYAALAGRLDIVQYMISERGCDPHQYMDCTCAKFKAVSTCTLYIHIPKIMDDR